MIGLLAYWREGLIVLAIGAALWFRAEAAQCHAAAALDAARAAERVSAAKALDANFARSLEQKLRPIVDQLQEQSHATAVALAKVPSNPGCAHTPAGDAFDRSVRPAGEQAHPGAARAARP